MMKTNAVLESLNKALEAEADLTARELKIYSMMNAFDERICRLLKTAVICSLLCLLLLYGFFNSLNHVRSSGGLEILFHITAILGVVAIYSWVYFFQTLSLKRKIKKNLKKEGYCTEVPAEWK